MGSFKGKRKKAWSLTTSRKNRQPLSPPKKNRRLEDLNPLPCTSTPLPQKEDRRWSVSPFRHKLTFETENKLNVKDALLDLSVSIQYM